MIFQLKSFRCFIFLLMLYGKVSCKYSSISVTKSGVQTPLQTDVAMVFYATVFNEGDHIQIVRLSMAECCLKNADSSNDCNSMKLRSGLGKALKPNHSYNLTMYWVNMNLFGRKGECHLNVNCQSKDTAQNVNEKSLEKLTIVFDTPLAESSDDVLQSIYSSVIGEKSANAGYRKCDILDQDLLLKCKKRRCILDYSGHRSFYDQGKDTCSITPDCSDSENMMISPVSNLCRKQTPTSKVLTSFTKEMKAGVNDTDITLRQPKAVAVEHINVVCVHGKMLENGHCQCDEHWLSQSFDPKKFDPDKTPYEMCNVRSPQGEIADRTNDTMYTFTILLIILLVVIPCFAIGLICYCHSKRKKRKMLEEERSDKLINHDEESDEEDVITEVASRREVKKSSTSHRSSHGTETGDSHQDFSNDKEPPQPPPDPNYSSSIHSNNSRNNLAGNGNSKNASRTRTNMKLHPDRSEKYDASHHSTTASHIIANNQPSRGGNIGKQKHKQQVWEMYPSRVISDPGTSQKFRHFSGFDEIPLVDLELVNTVQNAFRSKSAPLVNYDTSYTPQELYAVSPPRENIEVGNLMQTLFENEITQTNSNESIANSNILQNEMNLQRGETSDTDVRASVKRKQELWAQFLKDFSEKNPVRQHSEFGIKDIEHNPQQSHACLAKSLPIMSTNKKVSAREVENNENTREYDINVNEDRTYTVFKSNQDSNMLSYGETPELTHAESNPRINIEDLENRIKAAMKSNEKFSEMKEPGETNVLLKTNMTAAQRIEMSALNYEDGEPNDLGSDRVDSLLLLRALSKVNSSHSLGHSSSDTSDLVVGSPIGRNRFWVNQFLQDRDPDEINNFTDFQPPPHQITSKLKQETTLRTHPLNCNVPNSDIRQFAEVQNVNNICQDHKTCHEVPIRTTNPFLCCTINESEPTSTTLTKNKEGNGS